MHAKDMVENFRLHGGPLDGGFRRLVPGLTWHVSENVIDGVTFEPKRHWYRWDGNKFVYVDNDNLQRAGI